MHVCIHVYIFPFAQIFLHVVHGYSIHIFLAMVFTHS